MFQVSSKYKTVFNPSRCRDLRSKVKRTHKSLPTAWELKMHLVSPSAGGLKYDMTSIISEILEKNEPLEVIHWSRSTGHKNNLAFKSQFVLTENFNQKKLR